MVGGGQVDGFSEIADGVGEIAGRECRVPFGLGFVSHEWFQQLRELSAKRILMGRQDCFLLPKFERNIDSQIRNFEIEVSQFSKLLV